MSYYAAISKHGILKVLTPLIKSGKYFLNANGQIDYRESLIWDGPWLHAKTTKNYRCLLWHEIMFLNFHLLPSPCLNCYKVVVRPRTVAELFDLWLLQKRIDVPSKCGVEVRETVCGLYGGYFYNQGLEAGRERYEMVREEVSAAISPEIPVILKRGCTEFEMKFGDSSKYKEPTKNQLELEAELSAIFVDKQNWLVQPDHVIDHIQTKWLHYAYQNGDLTYLEFTDGKILFPKVRTYHEEIGNGKKKIENKGNSDGSIAKNKNTQRRGDIGAKINTKDRPKTG